MAEHTQGPLHNGGDGTIIYDQNGWGVANATIYHVRQEPSTSRSNARRLVACWNACEGKTTELLEAVAAYDAAADDAEWEAPHPIFQMAQQIDLLTVQRDQLLAALKVAESALDEVQGDINPERGYADDLENTVAVALSKARGAIADAKAGAQ